MKSLKKLLVSAIVLIVIGFIGLGATLAVGSIGFAASNLGTGKGYMFGREDFCNMERSSILTPEAEDLSFEKVKQLSQDYLSNYSQNLEIAEIMEFSKNYYIEVIEEDTGIGAMELLVDKSTGQIFPEYGPNMMWNTKYGMHSRMRSPGSGLDMPVDKEEAIEIADRYLSRSGIDEYVTDEAEMFYGYYTIHTTDEDGNIAGMLSVNGLTGDVWYHNWHGIFIGMEEYH
jgi:hypothetical protein